MSELVVVSVTEADITACAAGLSALEVDSETARETVSVRFVVSELVVPSVTAASRVVTFAAESEAVAGSVAETVCVAEPDVCDDVSVAAAVSEVATA